MVSPCLKKASPIIKIKTSSSKEIRDLLSKVKVTKDVLVTAFTLPIVMPIRDQKQIMYQDACGNTISALWFPEKTYYPG